MTTIDRAEVRYETKKGWGTYKGPIRFMPGGHVALFPSKADESAFGEPTVLAARRLWRITIFDGEVHEDQAGLDAFEQAQMKFGEDAEDIIRTGEKVATTRESGDIGCPECGEPKPKYQDCPHCGYEPYTESEDDDAEEG